MAIPGRIEEGLIQHRYGYSHDLPDYLEEAEIAMTVDNGGVYIGAPMFKAIDGRERSVSNIYPYHNIELLTEVSNNAEIIKIPFNIFNSSMNMPIVLIAYNPPSTEPALASSDIISINGIQIRIGDSDIDITQKCNTINELLQQKSSDISCDVYNNRFKITFYSKQGKSLILDSITDQALQRFGFVNPADSNIVHKVVTPTRISSRSLGDVLSDRISIKTFGTVNNADDNCSVLTNAAIDLMYRNKAEYLKKDLFIPAGEYNYETDSIYLFTNARLVGENNTKLTFKSNDLRYMISNTDIKGLNSQSTFYGTSEGDIKNIELDNLILQSKLPVNGIELYGVSDLRLNNCDIISGGAEKLFSLLTTTGSGTYLKNISDILYDTGTISNGARGISIEGTIYNKAKNIVIKNIKFSNITDSCIYLRYCDNVIIEHCDFTDANLNKFINIDYCSNIIIKDCIYPEDFVLNKVEDNKILMMHSSVYIDDYMYTTVSPEVNTPILALPNSKNELFNVILYYDVLSPEAVNRSGIITTYHYTYYSSERIRDNSLICDTGLRFTLRNGNNDNLLRIVCENDHNKVLLVRYKLAFNLLESSYEYEPRGDEDTEKTDLPSWLPQGGGGGFDPVILDEIEKKINKKQDRYADFEHLTNSIQGGENVEVQYREDGFLTINAQDTTYTPGKNISIENNEISATYTPGANIAISEEGEISATYTQGAHIAISEEGEISATYSEGDNITISEDGRISSTYVDTTYTAGENIEISQNNQISASEVLTRRQISNAVIKSNNVKVEKTENGLEVDTGTVIYIPAGKTVDPESSQTIFLCDKETVPSGILVPSDRIDSNSLCFLCYSKTDDAYFVKAVSKFVSGEGATLPSSGYEYCYNNTENKIGRLTGSIWTYSDQISLPLALVQTGANHEVLTVKTFDTSCYVSKTVFVLPGIEVLIPDGLTMDGQLNNIKVEKTDLTALEIGTDSVNGNVVVMNNDGTCVLGTNWIEGEDKPTFHNDNNEYWYDTKHNIVYLNTSSSFGTSPSILIGRFNTSSLIVTSMDAKNVFHAAEYDEHRVIEFKDWTSGSDYYWYRKYADGWVEQGGTHDYNSDITLPVSMKDTNYAVQALCYAVENGSDEFSVSCYIKNQTKTLINITAKHWAQANGSTGTGPWKNATGTSIKINWSVAGRYM